MRRESVLPHIPGDADMRDRMAWYLWHPPVLIPLALFALAALLLLVGLLMGGAILTVAAHVNALTSRTGEMTTAVKTLGVWLAPGTLVALLGVVIWVWPRALQRWRSASEAQFDAQLVRDLEWLTEHGRERLNLEYSEGATWGIGDLEVLREPLSITQGLWRGDLEAAPHLPAGRVRYRVGSDSHVRHSLYRITIAYTLQHHMSQFICEFDVTTGLILSERSRDAHYKDIVALETLEVSLREAHLPSWWIVTKSVIGSGGILALAAAGFEWFVALPRSAQEYVLRTFALELSSGGAMSIPFFGDPECDRMIQGGHAAHSITTRETIAALRHLLQEKRKGTVRLLEPAA